MTPGRQLGTHGPAVSALGFGAMVLSPGMYGTVDDATSIGTLQHAIDAGITFIDTSDAYGMDGHNERLVGQAIRGRRDGVVVATKFGLRPAPDGTGRRIDVAYDVDLLVNGRPEHVRAFAEASLRNFGIEAIDLYYPHFPDHGTPIEETVGAMADLVRAGLVRFIGLCNVTADQVRRAHAVHPIAAVQNEYSLWTRDPERDLLPTLRELGIGFVPWSPLGSGMLTGGVAGLAADDFRNRAPRFQGGNLRQNVDRFAPIRAFAADLAITPSQLALGWLLHQDDRLVPIPGTRSVDHLDENIAAASIALSPDALARLSSLAPAGIAAGDALLGA